MKKLLIAAVCAMAVTISCKQKGQTAPADSKDSVVAVIDSIIEENDTTPMPMFLFNRDEGKYLYMLYWTYLEEPQKSDDNADWFEEGHQSWALQEMFRRNAAQYTNLIDDEGIVKVKLVDEVLKDPDGNTPSVGEIHGRDDIPALCARLYYVNPKEAKSGFGGVVVTDSYLQSRRRLDIKLDQSSWNRPKPLPEAVVKQLEKQYGMKVERSRLSATFGEDYIWGQLQFKGEYKGAPKDEYDADRKSALALDVLIKGDEIFVNEELGYFDTNYGPTWNVDDDGEYVGCHIMAAFEGPKGLELCYMRGAPESTAVGMFYQRDGKLIRHNYETYHNMVDEEMPVWKKDLRQMDKIYHADEMGDKDVELTKWAHCFIDYENEWIWLRDKADENGAFFIRDGEKFRLMAIENRTLQPSRCDKDGICYLKLAGPAGGPSWQQVIRAFKGGKLLWTLFVLEIEGEISECMLNEKTISKEEGKAYLDKVPEGKIITAYFRDIENP